MFWPFVLRAQTREIAIYWRQEHPQQLATIDSIPPAGTSHLGKSQIHQSHNPLESGHRPSLRVPPLPPRTTTWTRRIGPSRASRARELSSPPNIFQSQKSGETIDLSAGPSGESNTHFHQARRISCAAKVNQSLHQSSQQTAVAYADAP